MAKKTKTSNKKTLLLIGRGSWVRLPYKVKLFSALAVLALTCVWARSAATSHAAVDVTISGRVVRDGNVGIKGVRLVDGHSPYFISAITDANGNFSFTRPQGTQFNLGIWDGLPAGVSAPVAVNARSEHAGEPSYNSQYAGYSCYQAWICLPNLKTADLSDDQHFNFNVSSNSKRVVKVMPLGDSITFGATAPFDVYDGGYRYPLWKSLQRDGFRADFVGSQLDGAAYGTSAYPVSADGDLNHEGHSGYRIDQIRANIGNWINTGKPDVVLLHIGSNDILQNYSVTAAPARLGDLLDRIQAVRPGTRILVSTILPLKDRQAQVDAYNAALTQVVNARIRAGRPITLVANMKSCITVSQTVDGAHPNNQAYSTVATVWQQSLEPVLRSMGY